MNPTNSLSVNSQNSLPQNMTVKEVSQSLGVSKDTILNCIKRIDPTILRPGKTTYLNEEMVAMISKELKSNSYSLAKQTVETVSTVVNSSTELEILANYKAANEAFVKLLEAKNNELQAIVNQQKPKVEFYDDVTGSSDTIEMKEVAKVLNCGMGRNKIFELLRNKKILDKNNQPYQEYVDRGYFRVIESKYEKDGDIKINLKTVVFQKGVDYIRRQIVGLSEEEIQTYRNKINSKEYTDLAIEQLANRLCWRAE